MLFNWFDYVIIASIAISAIAGLFRGFVKEVLSLLTWIIAVISSVIVGQHFGNEEVIRELLIGTGVFIGVLVLGSILTYLICKMVNITGVGNIIDRFLGLSYGVLRGSLTIVIGAMLLSASFAVEYTWWKDSTLMTQAELLSAKIDKIIPKSWKDLAAERLDRLLIQL